MSFGIIITHFAWIAHKLACSKSPIRKASPASCSVKTAALWNLSPYILFWVISLTSHWNGSLLINKSAPFWYFWISLRACIPFCILLFFSIFSSFTIFNCLSIPSLILWALLFSSLIFFIAANFLSSASLALSFTTFSFITFTILAISINRRWTLFNLSLQTLI